MNHIKDNFSKENQIHLSDNEIKYLKYYIETMSTIPSLECILIIPSHDNSNTNFYIRLESVMSGTLEERNFAKYIEKRFMTSIDKDVPDKRNKYFVTQTQPIETISRPELKSLFKKEIVSSYIVFDRNNRYTNLQDYLKEHIIPFGLLVEIDNIDLLKGKKLKEKKKLFK